MKILFTTMFMTLFISCAGGPRSPMSLKDAVHYNPLRSEDFMKRDRYRHPLETLSFFGIRPEMTVVEIWPSGGWYTEILAPYLSERGTYIIADPPSDPRGYTKRRQEWMAKNKHIADKVKSTKFLPPDEVAIAPAGTADMVLTFRNVHNWLPTANQEAAFRAFFTALKPGGILGVVEHRAPAVGFNEKHGYVPQEEVIRLATKAGFKLVGTSDVNANPKDTKDHPEGVWTLPPSLRLGERDKEKYLAIGESDRMTLKFQKP